MCFIGESTSKLVYNKVDGSEAGNGLLTQGGQGTDQRDQKRRNHWKRLNREHEGIYMYVHMLKSAYTHSHRRTERHTHIHTLTHTYTLSLTYTHTHSLSLTHTHTHSHTHTHIHGHLVVQIATKDCTSRELRYAAPICSPRACSIGPTQREREPPNMVSTVTVEELGLVQRRAKNRSNQPRPENWT